MKLFAAASLLVLSAACGSGGGAVSSSPPNPSPVAQASAAQAGAASPATPTKAAAAQRPSPPLAVQRPGLHGAVLWPDGAAVRSTQLDFYPGGLRDIVTGSEYNGPAGHYFKTQTDADGRYDLPTACNGVTCPALFVFILVPWPGTIGGSCVMPLLPQGYGAPANAGEPEILTVTPPATVDYTVVDGYCEDQETEYIANYTATTPVGGHEILPLNDGSSPPSWQQVKQFVNTGLLPVGDPCVVGRWVAPASTLTVNFSTGPVQLTGGDGLTVTIHQDGKSEWDYGTSRPFVAQVNGHVVEVQFAGTQETTVYATPPSAFNETLISYSVVSYLVIDGVTQSRQAETFVAATSYSCSSSSFTETAAGASATFARG